MSKRIANLTSNILSPFLVSFVVILLLSFEASLREGLGVLDALKWALIVVVVAILPVFLVTIYLVRNKRIDSLFIGVRKQRTKIYLLASVCAVVGNVIFIYFEAPLALVATFIAGLSAVVIFMGVNLWWKISIHTALVAASATILVMLYGWLAVATVALVAITAWARVELKYHSLAQVTAGALLATLIAVGALYPFLMT